MLIRSLTLATLFVVSSAVVAADSDSPLAQDRGRSRPVIVIAPSTLDPTLVDLKKALADPANRQAFNERNMVLYTVVNTIGQRDGKDLDAQSTMALIRQLKLGASAQSKVILVGKDGEKRLEHAGPIDPRDLFTAVDQLPAEEKEASVAPAPEPVATPVTKAGKTSKTVKALED